MPLPEELLHPWQREAITRLFKQKYSRLYLHMPRHGGKRWMMARIQDMLKEPSYYQPAFEEVDEKLRPLNLLVERMNFPGFYRRYGDDAPRMNIECRLLPVKENKVVRSETDEMKQLTRTANGAVAKLVPMLETHWSVSTRFEVIASGGSTTRSVS